jgi:serine/threonine-protein kinase SRPK3
MPYRVSEDLKLMQWPEENLSLDVDERGGFYPAKLGEVFDEARFVVTRKLGWGGFGNVWLARDRKCVFQTILYWLTISILISEKIDMLH